MGAGDGQAILTAECSHTFHLHCIVTSVAHGHVVCPLCNARWRDLPVLVRPAPAPPMHGVQPPQPRQPPVRHAVRPPVEPDDDAQAFDDDEPVEAPPGHGGRRQEASASTGGLVVKTHTEYSAIARDSSHDNFAVLVHVRAPGMADGEAAGGGGGAPRAPLDLVTVLDVSGSMGGAKLALLKQAMGFVIDNLGPHDRLSVVSFSSSAWRVSRLLRISDAGKGLSRVAVESLAACGGTNIAAGLRAAAKVLGERRHRNAVSSVILLSDGQDNYTVSLRRGSDPNYEALVPPSFTRAGAGAGGGWSAPVHTFGFGNDHDAAAMHVVAEATGGTFSYIEDEAAIQDAFAQCIGGLLSVVVQEARVRVACGHPGVRIRSVKSGRYESCVGEDGRAASINAGELYADEERRFLLFLTVPAAEAADSETTLIKVSCSYRDAAGGADVDVTAEDTVVARPEHAEEERSVEVERERVRVEAAEDIAAARAAAERGAHQEAVEILERRQRAVAQSAVARGGDSVSLALEGELREMRRRVASRESYARSGRAFVLAGVSMHEQQRANSSLLGASSNAAAPYVTSEGADAGSYATPAMRAMLLRSRRAREEAAAADVQQQPRGGGGEGRSVPEEAEQH
ncbi:hypothetical protein ACP4OV_004284 [Aristida adscensionis]